MIRRTQRYKDYKIVTERHGIHNGMDLIAFEWYVKVFNKQGEFVKMIEPIPNAKEKNRVVNRVKKMIDNRKI